jgi:hypothetical protein
VAVILQQSKNFFNTLYVILIVFVYSDSDDSLYMPCSG